MPAIALGFHWYGVELNPEYVRIANQNFDLWQRLEAAIETHHVKWHWVKGHAGHPENERADELARQGMAPYKKGG